MIEYPWPEREERVQDRIHRLVQSVIRPDELRHVRLDWVTPEAHRFDDPDAGWVALRVQVLAIGGESFQREVWGPEWWCSWDESLRSLAAGLEDWVCETRFAWAEQRHAVVPD